MEDRSLEAQSKVCALSFNPQGCQNKMAVVKIFLTAAMLISPHQGAPVPLQEIYSLHPTACHSSNSWPQGLCCLPLLVTSGCTIHHVLSTCAQGTHGMVTTSLALTRHSPDRSQSLSHFKHQTFSFAFCLFVLLLLFVCLFVYTGAHTCGGIHIEVGEQHRVLSSLLLPCVSWDQVIRLGSSVYPVSIPQSLCKIHNA